MTVPNPLPIGTTIAYQGKLCGTVFEFSRSVGLEPDFGTLYMSLEDFLEFTIAETLQGSDAPVTGTQEKQPTNLRGFASSGDLQFSEVFVDARGDRVENTVIWNQILLAERAVESAFAFDDQNDLCKVEVTDIRFLWATRGLVFGWINVPTQGVGLQLGALPSPTQPTTVSRGPGASTVGPGSAGSTVGPNANPNLSGLASLPNTDPSSSSAGTVFGKSGGIAYVTPPSGGRSASSGILTETEAAGTVIELPGGGTITVPAGGASIVPQAGGGFMVIGADGKPIAAQGSAGSAPPASPAQSSAQQLAGGGPQGGSGEGALYIPGSMKGATTPWTLLQVLVERVLPHLPGNPTLKRLPPGYDTRIPVGHVWDGVLAKHALRDLLEEFQMVLALNRDSSVSLWLRDEGDLQDEDGTIQYDPTQPENMDDNVANARRLVAKKWVPSTVAVLGPAIITTERITLEQCGEAGGQIVPLMDALAAIGLDMPSAQRFALLTHLERTSNPFNLSSDGLKAFEKWAFRWFRIPGGAERNPDKLPILNARGAVTASGALHPPKVYSASFAVVSIKAQRIAALAAAGTASLASTVGPRLLGDLTRAGLEVAVETIKKAPQSSLWVAVNLPFQLQDSGYDLDHERGIVKFHNVQGNVHWTGATTSSATLIAGVAGVDGYSLDACQISDFVPVDLVFCHTVKPGLNGDLSFFHRYASVWTRQPGGKALQVPQIPVGAAELPISRPDLQQIVDVDGSNNKATLDAFAQRVAQVVFSIPPSLEGATVTLCRPVTVLNTGKVLHVAWRMDAERPRTVATLNTLPPLAPAAELRTRAFGLPDGKNKALDHVLAPRGLRP